MNKRKIFIKNKYSNYKIYFFIFSFLLLLLFIIIFIDTNKFITIEEFTNDYYIIPPEKEGKIIPNINKQVLHLNLDNDQISLNNNELIKYSIQFYASIHYEKVKEKLVFYLKKNIFNKNDFSIVILEHSIGREYILLYKNFETKISAYDYCSKYIQIINTCLIVNVRNLD